jgi:hypothetical protein
MNKLALTPLIAFIASMAGIGIFAATNTPVPSQLYDFAKLALGAALVQTPQVIVPPASPVVPVVPLNNPPVA